MSIIQKHNNTRQLFNSYSALWLTKRFCVQLAYISFKHFFIKTFIFFPEKEKKKFQSVKLTGAFFFY